MQKKLNNYDKLKQNNEKVKADLKTKREEFNKVNSSYNRLKKIADDLRAESKRPTSKKDWEEGSSPTTETIPRLAVISYV